MFCDSRGRPDPNGDYELINGKLCLRDGRSITFPMMFRDKIAAEPKSIDEALRQRFAEMAKARGTTVAEMLSSLQQSEIEEAATAEAKAFVNAQAGKGIAAMFGDSFQRAVSAAKTMQRDAFASYLTDDERGDAKSKVVRDWAMRHAYLGTSAPPLSAAQEAAAIEDAATQKARRVARAWDIAQLTRDTAAAEAGRDTLRQMQKEQLSTAWRSPRFR